MERLRLNRWFIPNISTVYYVVCHHVAGASRFPDPALDNLSSTSNLVLQTTTQLMLNLANQNICPVSLANQNTSAVKLGQSD